MVITDLHAQHERIDSSGPCANPSYKFTPIVMLTQVPSGQEGLGQTGGSDRLDREALKPEQLGAVVKRLLG